MVILSIRTLPLKEITQIWHSSCSLKTDPDLRIGNTWTEFFQQIFFLSFYFLGKEVMFSVALVGLFVCLFVCMQHYSKIYERIATKFYGRVRDGKRIKWFEFCSDPDCPCWLSNWKSGHYSRNYKPILMIALQWYKEQLTKVLWWPGSPCLLSKSGIQAIWG